MNIGIDLGTTFSVIAVKGKVSLREGYPPPDYLPECDITIIPTPDGDRTFPSVFWVDPDNPNNILIGTEAKQKAVEGHSPIMFSKRSIGTDEPLKINDRTFTAKEVATHILRYLKDCAEQALGEPVRRAVITHPAHFTPNQVEETREAAQNANFDMSYPEQMMMEPTAAALAYFKDDQRDPLRVLAYDLGGGTFDVTILERREGIVKMRAFGGDHLLGGYNFDRELVEEILNRLKAAGRDIPYDENNAEDRGRRARLLQVAENVKIQLSEQKNDKIFVQFRLPNVLVDSEGRQVQILERINREQYTALIQDHLDKTIDCCRSALSKAGMSLDELDAILLVGASTYGPWVTRRIAEELKMEVVPYSPDVCVAAGAAIMADQLLQDAVGENFKILLDVASTSALPETNVSGTLLGKDSQQLSEADRMHLRVSLLTPLAGKLGPVSLSKNGRFIFDDVKLLEDEPSSFSLQVDDEGGRTLLTHEFKVRYAPDDVEINTFINSLPHPLYLRVAGGMKLIADEGVDLPAKCEVTVSKLRAESELKLRIYLKEDEVGFILIENIPEEAGEGCPVMLDLEITERGVLKGIASVLNRNDTVVAQSEVRIKFPPIALPTLPELRNQFDTLEDKRQQELDLSAIPERRTLLGGKGQKLANRIKKLFGEQEPDKQELAREIREMDRLINPPRDDMDPPRAYFMGLLETCMNLMDAKGSDPEVQPLRSMWDRINEDGREAYMTRNHKRWTTVYESLRLLYDRLSKLGKKENGDNDEIPPTEILKDAGHQVVEGLRALLATERLKHESLPEYATRIRPRVDEIEKALGEIDAKIHKIKSELPPKQGQAQVQIALLPARKLEKDIGLLTEEIEDRKGAYSNGYRN